MKKSSEETWLDNRWRPAMAWLYFAICAFDFMLAPIFLNPDWAPLTLGESGTFHFAMGAIITATAYSRGQEKIRRMQYEKAETDKTTVSGVEVV